MPGGNPEEFRGMVAAATKPEVADGLVLDQRHHAPAGQGVQSGSGHMTAIMGPEVVVFPVLPGMPSVAHELRQVPNLPAAQIDQPEGHVVGAADMA